MKNISLSIFQLDGVPRLVLEPSNHSDRVRLVILDAGDRHWRAGDVIFSLPIEQADDLARAVAAFNAEMKLCEVTP